MFLFTPPELHETGAFESIKSGYNIKCVETKHVPGTVSEIQAVVCRSEAPHLPRDEKDVSQRSDHL